MGFRQVNNWCACGKPLEMKLNQYIAVIAAGALVYAGTSASKMLCRTSNYWW